MKKGAPSILWAKNPFHPPGCELAFQSGPVIVEPSGVMGVYRNDYLRLNRSAIGVSGKRIVLAVIKGERGSGLSLYEFAEFCRAPVEQGGADCDAALNLDGGASTQTFFRFDGITAGVEGLWAINSAIVVKRRPKKDSDRSKLPSARPVSPVIP
jgi:uncharacterized protein YigE (DUF2233 family)